MLARQITRHLGGGTSLSPISRPLLIWAAGRPQLIASSPHKRRLIGQPLSQRRGIHFIETSVQQTQELITALHVATGTPWWLTIPLVAVALNVVLRLPFNIYARRLMQRRAPLDPLVAAATSKVFKGARLAKRSTAPSTKELVKMNRAVAKKIYVRWGVQEWKMYGSLLSLPFWLVCIESIRRMCGGPKGLLGNWFFPSGEEGASVAAAAGGLSTATTPGAVVEATSVADATSSTLDSNAISDAAQSLASSGFETGGTLWFPNLMETDPYHALPFLLSAILVYNILPSSAESRRRIFNNSSDDRTYLGGGRIALQRSLIILGLAIGPATIDMPAALHWYWICSAGTSALLTKVVAMQMPMPKSNIKRPTGQHTHMPLPQPKENTTSGKSGKQA